ncbi:ATP-binding protein [Luteirhabdus pelagi]|jgi:AAA+ superfamily predicted ATPase|uniref:ATP-binding protein n=1 Tax=Luteirhabdus pelagi TaxID=2792783 RepID=UPI001F40DEDA|nr:ATP-binding protein [Luteirhabdus pelagi]
MMKTSAYTEIKRMIDSFTEVLIWRLQHPTEPLKKSPQLSLSKKSKHPFFQLIEKHELSTEEVIILLLTWIPHLSPSLLIDTVSSAYPSGTDFPLFGGVKGKNHRGILPTGETAQFLIGGTDISMRTKTALLFTENNTFHRQSLLHLEEVPTGEPTMSGKILLHDEILHFLKTGEALLPTLSTRFPAQLLETSLTWDDLILDKTTMEQVKELEVWLQYNKTFMEDWNMKDRVKPGFRALFAGPSGTGKTLTATLLGKYTERPVYRVDLSTVVSKYIGETEKNLSSLFDKAQNKNWILFFDEADAIFGKRTNVRDAHDKYANQEVSYLLQRVESHSGLVILASNFKNNIDEAFTRRFNSICEFKKPGVAERKQLWERNLPKQLSLSKEIDWDSIARKYELTGSNIVNIIHYSSLQVLHLKNDVLTLNILQEGIRKEYKKEDKLM